MRILYLTTSAEDYLQDQILVGLRALYGENVIDCPKKDIMYENCDKPKDTLYGCGFTIWRTLEDIDLQRNSVEQSIGSGEFDLIVFGSVRRQKDLFWNVFLNLFFRKNRAKICFLDGEDDGRVFLPAIFLGKYFKREQRRVFRSPFAKEINFSIPAGKIRKHPIAKDKQFAVHVQCEEAYHIEEIRKHCKKSYAFSDEQLYYDDIARSEYAIAMKKGGWECMRHYEIAANHTVPCFYELNKKPRHCAPHGLVDMENVVSFNTGDELRDKIATIREHGLYSQLQKNAFDWAKSNTCKHVAERMMAQL